MSLSLGNGKISLRGEHLLIQDGFTLRSRAWPVLSSYSRKLVRGFADKGLFLILWEIHTLKVDFLCFDWTFFLRECLHLVALVISF